MDASLKPRIKPASGEFWDILQLVKEKGLHTVCQESRCPNQAECWSGGTATFMVMGDMCTRACRFCNVKTFHKGRPLDPGEPGKLAEAAKKWGLDYVVVTSVDRDDLPDQGAGHFAECISELRKAGILVEALIPDFREQGLKTLLAAGPDVVAHNIETVSRLQSRVRDPRAGYERSLGVLKSVKNLGDCYTKSSIMLGLGETDDEILETMKDLRKAGVDFLTLGQYLQPTQRHLPVSSYLSEEKWGLFREQGRGMGFMNVASGPLVRSSYRAGEFFVSSL